MNERLAYGKCEGMVVLVSKLFNEKRNGLRLGNTSDLTKDQLAQQIPIGGAHKFFLLSTRQEIQVAIF
jgi:hypothetical protein